MNRHERRALERINRSLQPRASDTNGTPMAQLRRQIDNLINRGDAQGVAMLYEMKIRPDDLRLYQHLTTVEQTIARIDDLIQISKGRKDWVEERLNQLSQDLGQCSAATRNLAINFGVDDNFLAAFMNEVSAAQDAVGYYLSGNYDDAQARLNEVKAFQAQTKHPIASFDFGSRPTKPESALIARLASAYLVTGEMIKEAATHTKQEISTYLQTTTLRDPDRATYEIANAELQKRTGKALANYVRHIVERSTKVTPKAP